MSLIFGIFNRNGRPVNPEDMDTIHLGMLDLPHEKYNISIQDNIAFGHMLTYNTPESLYEQMPKYLPEQKLLFVSQGRIDNREELADILNIRITDTVPDGEIILKAYLKWGEKTPDYLLGDWSFAAFDTEKQNLFIARDHHGYTDINYYIDDKIIVFSTSIKGILALKYIPQKLNENILIRSLVLWGGKENHGNTYYKDIYHLLPAHTLNIGKEFSEKKRYWFPENIETVHGKKPDEYADELKEILNKAIKVRLRSYKPVVSMLSGGLDSSTVSFLAAELLKKEGKKLTTYSHVPLYEPSKSIDKARFGDERPYIEAIVKASGNINPVYLDSKDITPIDGMFKMLNILNGPVHAACNSYWLVDIPYTASKSDFGTLLTGEHGNANISFTGLDYLLTWQMFYKAFGLKKSIKQKIIKPIVFNHFENIYKRIRYKENHWETYSHLNPQLGEKINLNNLMKSEGHDSTFKFYLSDSKEMMLKIIMPGFNPRCYLGAIMGNSFGVEWRDPTADKRVIEYALTIPNEAYFNEKGEWKQILKLMMGKQLPDKVLYEKGKGLQSADIGLRITKEKERLDEQINKLSESSLVKEYIDLKKLKNEWEQVKSINDNSYDNTKIHHLLRTIMISTFLTRFD